MKNVVQQVFMPTEHLESGKFIVITCGAEIYIAVAPPHIAEWHKDLFALFQKENDDMSCICIGGGKMCVEDENVTLYGTSTVFGTEPDRDMTRQILSKRFSGYNFTVE